MRPQQFSSIGRDLTLEVMEGKTYITNKRNINKIVIHCSASPQDRGDDAHDIDRWHLQRGWSGIGYHYVILEDGTIQKGRWIDNIGSHARGHNRDTIAICRIGGYDCEEDVTDDQLDSIVALSKLLIKGYGLTKDDIVGHRELPKVAKCCPAMNVDIIRDLVDQ